MALYTYQATDSSGRAVKGTLEAKDEGALVDILQDMGYFPVRIESPQEGKKKAGPASRPFFSKRISSRELLAFTHELSALLEAGLALDRALAILKELEKNERLKEVIAELHGGIHAGNSLADCLEKHPRVFSDVYVSAVKAGEAGGALELVLGRLCKFMEEAQKLKEELGSALLYPAILTFAGGGAIGLMIFFVIPKFAAIFADMGAAMPLPTRILMWFADGAITYWWLIMALLAAFVFWIKRVSGSVEGRLRLDALKLRAPLIGPILIKAAVSRFSRTLGTLLQGGIPVLEAHTIALKGLGNSWMEREMEKVAEGVRKGRGMAAPLREAGIFPELALQMLTVGEETGKLDEMLAKIAEHYDRDISVSLKRLLSLLEPGIILLMAIIAGFIIISLLLAIFSLNDMAI